MNVAGISRYVIEVVGAVAIGLMISFAVAFR